ncbi:MAG TPA: ABC transporter ATP-binding protein [Gaiellaceae bacterium]|jgi:ABC-2 type transport system ATP-binding protein
MSAAISVEGLRVSRGGQLVLRDLSLEVAASTVTGLLGPSGCGKTTLMRSIVGVQVVERGRIEVLGLPAGAPALRSRVGYVTQSPSVYGDLTVEQNLSYFASITASAPRRVHEAMAAVGLGDVQGRLVRTLSGGQRSRVSLASALVNRPDLLVLDEPTVGLDPVLRADLWERFHRLADGGTTLIVSSHVMDEAAECDALLLMREGEILEQTTPAGLRAETGEHELGKAFLAVIRRAAG